MLPQNEELYYTILYFCKESCWPVFDMNFRGLCFCCACEIKALKSLWIFVYDESVKLSLKVGKMHLQDILNQQIQI